MSGSAARPPRSGSLYLTVAAAVVASLPVFLVGALAVQLTAALDFEVGALGIAISLYFLGAAVSSVPMSRLAEAVGALRIMKVACVFIGVLFILLAFAVRNWAGLVAVLIPAGIANGALQPAINQYISNRVPRSRQGLVFGIKQSSIPFCALVGGVSVPAIALTVGWQWVFVCAAAASVVAGFALPKPNPGRRRRTSNGPMPSAMRRSLGVLTLGFSLGLAAANALTGFLVIATVASGVPDGPAGLLLSLGSISAIAARVLLGAWADSREPSTFLVVAIMLGLGGAGFVMLALGAASTSPLLVIPGVLLAFASGWGWNGLFNLGIIRHYPDRPALATGIVQTGGRVGGFVGPLLFGFVSAHASYAVAYLSTAGALVVATVVILAGLRILPPFSGR